MRDKRGLAIGRIISTFPVLLLIFLIMIVYLFLTVYVYGVRQVPSLPKFVSGFDSDKFMFSEIDDENGGRILIFDALIKLGQYEAENSALAMDYRKHVYEKVFEELNELSALSGEDRCFIFCRNCNLDFSDAMRLWTDDFQHRDNLDLSYKWVDGEYNGRVGRESRYSDRAIRISIPFRKSITARNYEVLYYYGRCLE